MTKSQPLSTMASIVYNSFLADVFNRMFKQNTRRRTLKSGNLIIRCKRGLWSCEGPDHEEVERQASHYFLQYCRDGEYS